MRIRTGNRRRASARGRAFRRWALELLLARRAGCTDAGFTEGTCEWFAFKGGRYGWPNSGPQWVPGLQKGKAK